jgi:hypothetical protein
VRLRDATLALTGVLTAVAAAAPAYTAILYYRYGRERRPTQPVPEGFPPNTGEKPWMVAALYTGHPGKPGWRVLASTILWLEARGLVRRVQLPRGGVGLEVSGEPGEGLDPVEASVLRILHALSGGSGLVSREAAKWAAKDRRVREILRTEWLNIRGRLRELAEEAIDLPRRFTLMVGAAAGALIALWAGMGIISSRILRLETTSRAAGVIAVLGVAAYLALLLLPRHVMGRWRPGYLERRLAWERFRERATRAGPPPGAVQEAAPGLAAYLVAAGVSRTLDPTLNRVLESVEGLSKRIYRVARPPSYGRAGGGGAGAR